MAKKFKIPSVTSLMGLDRINHKEKSFVGFIGTYGESAANKLLNETDLLVVIGSRLDQRQTGKDRSLFAPNAKIVHVDIDPSELGHFFEETISIESDSTEFMAYLNQKLLECNYNIRTEWLERINEVKASHKRDNCFDFPRKLLECMGKEIPDRAVVCADVGLNQMMVAQSLRIQSEDFYLLNSGGLGTMGYALPASIGAYYGGKRRKVFAIMGDGGFQMNIQELQLIADRKIPITIIVVNNQTLGMIKEIQEKWYEGRCYGTVEGFSCPSIKKIAEAYGIDYMKIETMKDIELDNEIVENMRQSIIIELKCSSELC